MRDQIIAEIKRIVAASGKVPGRAIFERETGIRPSQWLGVYWARWGGALTDAGFAPNEKQGRIDPDFLFGKLVDAFRHYGREPTSAEFEMYRQVDPSFPWYSTITGNFGSKTAALKAFAEWLSDKPDFAEVLALLPSTPIADSGPRFAARAAEGHVYLLKSGNHYKIGRSDELERRVKEIRVALPEAAALVHTIRTDDPPGIEAYWHRRFADKRANGEWFRLSVSDVAAFKRRTFM